MIRSLLVRKGDALLLRIARRAQRLLDEDRTRQLRAMAEIAPDARLMAECRIENIQNNPSRIRVGPSTTVRAHLLVMGHGGEIQIGSWCFIGEHTHVWSSERITVGDRVLISHACEIHDGNSHALAAQSRHEHYRAIFTRGHPATLPDVPAAPVRIEDDVWIGFGSTVMKGVTIGRGAIVAARTVVLHDVEPFTLVAGNPARVIRRLEPA